MTVASGVSCLKAFWVTIGPEVVRAEVGAPDRGGNGGKATTHFFQAAGFNTATINTADVLHTFWAFFLIMFSYQPVIVFTAAWSHSMYNVVRNEFILGEISNPEQAGHSQIGKKGFSQTTELLFLRLLILVWRNSFNIIFKSLLMLKSRYFYSVLGKVWLEETCWFP